MTYKKGFTLVEIVVVLAVFLFIIIIGFVVDLGFLKRDTLRAERALVVSVLEKARNRSMNNMFGTIHGVCYAEPYYIIFKNRTTCLPRHETDETIPTNSAIANASNFSTTFPVVTFSQLAGTTTGASIELTDGVESLTIEINNEGAINW